MVNRPPDPVQMNDFGCYTPHVTTHFRKGRRATEIRWPEPLYQQILTEAINRKWSFNRMVRHLCEASIEGIE